MLAGPWYLSNLDKLKHDFTENTTIAAQQEGDPIGISFESFTYYLRVLLDISYHLPLFIFFLIGFIFLCYLALFKKNSKKVEYIILVVFLLSSYLTFSYLANKDARYIIPLLGVASIFCVFWVFCIKNKKARIILTGLLLVINLLNYYFISFGNLFLPKKVEILKHALPIFTESGYIIGHPIKADSKFGDIFADIKDIGAKEKILHPIRVSGFFFDEIRFNSWDFAYYSEKDGIILSPVNNYSETKLGEVDFLIVAYKNEQDNQTALERLKLESPCYYVELIREYYAFSIPGGVAKLYRIKPGKVPCTFTAVSLKSDISFIDYDKFLDQKVLTNKESNGYLNYGPYIKLGAGEYKATYVLKVNKFMNSKENVKLEVWTYNPPTSSIVAAKTIIPDQPVSEFSSFPVEFSLDKEQVLEFKTYVFPNSKVELKKIILSHS